VSEYERVMDILFGVLRGPKGGAIGFYSATRGSLCPWARTWSRHSAGMSCCTYCMFVLRQSMVLNVFGRDQCLFRMYSASSEDDKLYCSSWGKE